MKRSVNDDNSYHEELTLTGSRDSTLLTKIYIVKAMVFPVVMYGCEKWDRKKLTVEELMLLNCGVGEDS